MKYYYFTLKTKILFKKDTNYLDSLNKFFTKYPIITELTGQPYLNITKRAILTRMGKGKSPIIGTAIVVYPKGIICQGYVKAEYKAELLRLLAKSSLLKKNSSLTFLFVES